MRPLLSVPIAALCLPTPALAWPPTCANDLDADGYIDAICSGPDCDDADPAVFPGAPEACDGVDSDCDGLPDDNDPHAGATVVLSDDFEVGDGGFASNAGAASVPLWAWGAPSSGPGAAFSGIDVWATVLTGDYAEPDNSAFLDSPLVTLPAAPALELSFAYWQDNEGECDSGDYTSVELYLAAGGYAALDNADPCPGGLADTGSTWLRAAFDLAPWAGQSAWFRVAHDTDSADNGFPGTYLDDFRIVTLADGDGDGWSGCADCDDAASLVHPGAAEICDDGIDNDCDGVAAVTDFDLDGVASPACGGDDCDDTSAITFPGAPEACDDGVDTDCDGADPAGDADSDGEDSLFCGGSDCDDADPTTSSGAPELCDDGADNDCDPSTPDVFDADLDGWPCTLDCDESDPAVHPGAAEVECDGADNDCNPATVGDPDVDGDGSVCGLDCDDEDPARSHLLSEVCDDGIDNDCNPSTADTGDFDFDGWGCLLDCDDTDPSSYPGAPEICGDGLDQDCDGMADELVDDVLDLGDDGSATIALCSFTFPFCGQDWDQVVVQANGRVTFGFDDGSASALSFFFVQQVPEIAALWSDLDPGTGGEVSVQEAYGSSLLVEWSGVPLSGFPSTSNTAALELRPDGTATLDFGAVDAQPSVVGFACGAGDVVAVDLGSFALPAGAWGIGSGTEDALYEQFDAANPLDLSLASLDLCLTAGQDGDGDWWTFDCGDCDDADPSSHPMAAELCDGFDQDCDGVPDDLDADGDGFVSSDCGGDDCDDGQPGIHPGAAETCNGVDDDCDGASEILDADGDGFSFCDDDCDDGDSAVNPSATEVCNQHDDDCDELIDEGFVADGDGDGRIAASCAGDDCDDGDATVHPGAEEVCNLGVDDDCDGVADDVDADLDGHLAAACGGGDCDDSDPLVGPDVVEVPYDGIDNDCDGRDTVDADHDGHMAVHVEGGTDCDDEDAAVNPDAPEVCDDGIDNDCNGLADTSDPACRGCGCALCLDAGDRAFPGMGAVLVLAGALAIRRRRGPARQRRRRAVPPGGDA